jgi:hypothetical protein
MYSQLVFKRAGDGLENGNGWEAGTLLVGVQSNWLCAESREKGTHQIRYATRPCVSNSLPRLFSGEYMRIGACNIDCDAQRGQSACLRVSQVFWMECSFPSQLPLAVHAVAGAKEGQWGASTTGPRTGRWPWQAEPTPPFNFDPLQWYTHSVI